MTVLEEHSRCKKYKYLGVPQKGSLKKKTEGMIMAAQDQALRTNSIKRIIDEQNVQQSAECVEKAMRQLAILYRNARNLIKSNIEVGGKRRWRR